MEKEKAKKEADVSAVAAPPAEQVCLFEPVLEKGERVVAIHRPSKAKFWTFTWVTFFFSVIWMFIVPVVLLWDADGYFVGVTNSFWISFAITGGVTLLTGIITWICGALWMRNTYFSYSDRRILIRTGIIGIDYKSLEFKSLNATVVRVSILDKIVRRNTGTIKFGSPSSPVLSFGAGHSNQYMFSHIQKPYETLKIIKEHIHDVAGE